VIETVGIAADVRANDDPTAERPRVRRIERQSSKFDECVTARGAIDPPVDCLPVITCAHV